jgi:hypothetical protein
MNAHPIKTLFLLAGILVNVVLPPPPSGGRNEIQCETLYSQQLYVSGEWGGLPAFKSVKDSARYDPCPSDKGLNLSIQPEPMRHYQLTLKWRVYDAKGVVVSEKLLPPYFLWAGLQPSPTTPMAPTDLRIFSL